jgi:hypothetical protein
MDKATDSASWIPSLVPTLISAFLTFLFGVTGVKDFTTWLAVSQKIGGLHKERITALFPAIQKH